MDKQVEIFDDLDLAQIEKNTRRLTIRNRILDNAIQLIQDELKVEPDKSITKLMENILVQMENQKKLDPMALTALNFRKYKSSDQLINIINTNKYEKDLIVYAEDSQKFIALRNDDDIRDCFEVLGRLTRTPKIKYQVVFSDEEQKLMFKYDGGEKDENLEAIRKIIQNYFNTDVIIKYNEKHQTNQIVVNKNIPDYDSGMQIILQIQREIMEKLPNTTKNVSIITPFDSKIPGKYYLFNSLGVINDYKEVIKNLNTQLDLNKYHNANININIGGNMTVVNNNYMQTAKSKSKKINKQTEEWINKNLPYYQQSTTEYYELYCQHMEKLKLKNLVLILFQH